MAKIITKKIRWNPSESADVQSHNVYVCPDSQPMTYETPHASVAMPTCEYILPGMFNMGTEGNFKLGISAVDGMGNESDQVVTTAPFDFVAPLPPSGVQVVNA